MKNYFAILILGLGIGHAKAQNTLTVQFTNLLPGKGTVMAGLYNSKEAFPKVGRQMQQRVATVKGTTATVSFTNLPAGDYAVAAFQDENANKKCDTNFMGIPKEGYGFSNNFHPKMAAPAFDDTKIHLAGDKAIVIKMIR